MKLQDLKYSEFVTKLPQSLYDFDGNLVITIENKEQNDSIIDTNIKELYDQNKNILLKISKNDIDFILFYYFNGNRIKKYYSNEFFINYEYNNKNQLIKSIDKYNFTVNYSYNDDGFVIKEEYSKGYFLQTNYDENNNITSITNNNGYNYDYSK